MKKEYFVSFSVPLSEGDRFRDFVASIGCLDSWQEPFTNRGRPFLSHTFDGSDPNLAALRELLTSEGIKWSEREEHVYSDAELRSFPLLGLGVDRKPLDEGGPQCGTTYDLSTACPRCGTGAIQSSPLMLPKRVLAKKKGLLCVAAHDETLVAEPLMEALRDADLTGLELRQVHSPRRNEPLSWWQMISSYVMPRMSPVTKSLIHDAKPPPCTRCRRDGYYGNPDEPGPIIYSRREVDLSQLPDVVHSWESFGKSGIDKDKPHFSRYGDHMLFVKPRVFDIFRRLKVRHTCFGPVRIID